METHLSTTIEHIPERPGVYQFYNKAGEILYIGKAKNLKKRVSSYFNRSSERNYKQEVLVSRIEDIRYVLVEHESDALLLENNLIKEFKPKYNVMLKDDKTFPWICIKDERFPRVFYTRKVIQDGSQYFGPYTSVVMLKTLFALIKQLYTIRTCNYLLTKENIQKGKFKRCLEYHLGNCKAPCEGIQSEADYNKTIEEIREILKGNIRDVMNYLRQMMKRCAENYQFEEAQVIKQKLELLEKFRAKSTIVNPKIKDSAVYSLIDDEKSAFVNYLRIIDGAIVQAHNVEVVKRIDEDREDMMASVIFDIQRKLQGNPKEIILPFMPNITIENILYTVPERGDKRKLLDLSRRNAASYRIDRIRNKEGNKRILFEEKAMISLRDALRLKKMPVHIECVDISNIQGSHAVASCVVFKDGKPSRADYRHYNIKTVTGADDFASMEEIVSRRFRHFKENHLKPPDLFVVDGGKGQLNAALKGIHRTGEGVDTAIIGIAKKLEEIYLPGDSVPLYLDKNAPGLKLIQRIRNEAHRFGITFHRKKRSRNMLLSELDQIKGIGPASKQKILEVTKDISELRKMSRNELEIIIGSRTAKALYGYFHSPDKEG